MSRQAEYLLVYGTLMPGRRLHGYIEQYVKSARPATVEGVLIDMGSFPALIPGHGLVKGVLLEISPEALAVTDKIEGCHPDPNARFYSRERMPVQLEDGGKAEAWVYVHAHPSSVADFPRLVLKDNHGREIYAWSPPQR